MKTYKFQVMFDRECGAVVITKRPKNIPLIVFSKDEIGTDVYNVSVTVCGER